MNTDNIMVDTWLSMAKDFRLKELDATYVARPDISDIKTFRDKAAALRMDKSPWTHKVVYQMDSYFKRYIFSNDVYTKQELEWKANEDFVAFQENLAAPRAEYLLSTKLILRTARKLVREVLGPFDTQEFMRLCRFGKRAAVEVTATEAYLDNKVENLSCSEEHGQWFLNDYLPGDHLLDNASLYAQKLREYEKKRPNCLNRCTCLSLVNVPKKCNTLRSIMPNTVIGGFYTLGIGKYIEERMRSKHRDIRKLQDKHKRLAQQSSRTRKLVTLDLSKASENYVQSLINILTPRDWYNALKFGRIKYATVGDRKIYLQSFMAMGIGYTFPLQTLLFESVIRAIALHLGERGTISVYGDDCIYPRTIHKYVLSVFKDLGFPANVDKTFDTQYFRESCGGDYYRGIDVRPFSPQAISADLKGVKLEAFLYKILNGILRRWDAAEVPSTVEYLLRCIAASAGRVYQVPLSFPDTAGVKVSAIQKTWYVPWTVVSWSPSLANFVFPYLYKQAGERLVRSVYPYYWNAMRTASLDVEEQHDWTPWDEAPAEQIKWVAASPVKYYRSRISKKRLRSLVAVVPSKVAFRYRPMMGQTSLGEWCASLELA